MSHDITRRTCLAALATATLAMARRTVGGRLRLSVPWGLSQLDPHDANDPAAAFFGSAVAEAMFGRDSRGRYYPTLAHEMPTPDRGGCVVRLRAGLKSSAGHPIDNRDLVWSVTRARRFGARALLAGMPNPKRLPDDPLAVVFDNTPAEQVLAALSSPLCALLPRAFGPKEPEGTGAFRASLSGGELLLQRNVYGARGPSYLEAIEVRSASDLAEGLRQFESGEVDLGWLGRGLHHPREDSRLVNAGRIGWVVLHSGKRVGPWGSPGAAAGLLASIAPSQLERFGLGNVGRASTRHTYGGQDCELLTRSDSTYLVELGRSLSELLGSAGHRIQLVPSSANELARRKQDGDFGFILDITRSLGPSQRELQLSLLQEANTELARRPPAIPTGISDEALVQRTTAMLNMAAIGELNVVVGAMPHLQGLAGWQPGDFWILDS